MNKIVNWGNGPKFIRVSKKKYENFRRFFGEKIEGNLFMDWVDTYDWSLRSGKYEIGSFKNAEECKVARHYCGYAPRSDEFYIRLDYIEKKHYDLNTIVPKPRKKRLTKKEKAFAKHICNGFDALFRAACKKTD